MPVLGAVVLFASWALQQSLLQRTTTELQALVNAFSNYQTYQSNNAIFNALIEVSKHDPSMTVEIRRFQIYNYEMGLVALENSLRPGDLRDVPGASSPYFGIDMDKAIEQTQKRLEALQTRVADRRAELTSRNNALQYFFLALYAGGSCTILIGSYLKAANVVRERKTRRAPRRGKEPGDVRLPVQSHFSHARHAGHKASLEGS